MAQVFYTARELAEVAAGRSLTCFPNTESAAIRWIRREGWNDLPPNLARKRAGRTGGGGMEYHISCLPGAMQNIIHGGAIKVAECVAQAARADADRRKLAALGTLSLSARQRAVMEARAQVLLAIEGYAVARGMNRAGGIRDFLAAQLDFPAWLTDPAMFGLTEAALATANDRPRESATLSRATVYGWFKARDAHGVGGLAPAVTREVQPLPPGFDGFLRRYAQPMKPSITEALADHNASTRDPAQRLTIDQVRHVLKVKLNDIERNVGREGLLTLRSRMAYVQRTTENLWPTTIYTADGKTFDAEVADPRSGRPIRPELTSILDVATRKCVGFAVSRKENVVAVTEALRNACVGHGIPAIFYTDRGAGYRNGRIDGVDGDVNGLMGRLSITKMHALPYNSQAKGIIERFNGTVWNPLAQKLPTYMGAAMDKEAKKAVHKQTRAEIAEFGVSRTLPSWADFRAMCEAAIAAYNARPHSALPKIADPVTGRQRPMSPDEAWAAHVARGFMPVPVDEDIRDDLFRPYEVRVARRSLVEWNTNQYYHPALEAHHGERVMVGYDDAQARYVWVRELDRDEGQPGRLICVADFTANKVDYIPRTMQAAAEEKRAKGRLKLVEHKRRTIEAERSAPQIEHQPTVPLAVLQGVEVLQPAAVEPLPQALPTHPRRRTFASDEDLALWALDHRDELTPNQIAVLRRCMQSHDTREYFRMCGVDTEALRTLLRAVA